MNLWKTSDIRISKDSAGFFDASHKHQGKLFESLYCTDRKEARRVAVGLLQDKKQAENV